MGRRVSGPYAGPGRPERRRTGRSGGCDPDRATAAWRGRQLNWRGRGRMRHPALPRALVGLPWRLLLVVAGVGLFGLVVLFSAAGGSLTPWAANQYRKSTRLNSSH